MGALCCVGRGFGRARRAGLGWAWDLAVLGALGWAGVGFGRAGRAGWVGRLRWARIWLSVYGLHCTCLLPVFMLVI